MVSLDSVKNRIQSGVPGVVYVDVEDLTGTGDHLQAIVVSESFAGQSRIEQHQAVYRALGDWMAGPIHALALQTYTPETWAKNNRK